MPHREEPGVTGLDLELGAARVQLSTPDASPPATARVLVAPTDSDDRADVLAAERTTVSRVGDRLVVTTRHGWNDPRGRHTGSVDVRAELPAGCAVAGSVAKGAVRAVGTLGACRLSFGAADVDLERAASVRLRGGAGNVTVAHATELEVTTGAGDVRLGTVDGPALVKTSNGRTGIDEVHGDLTVHSANGDVTVGRVDGRLTARTANGDIQAACVCGPALTAETGRGGVVLGLGAGRAAWLDVRTGLGTVQSALADTEPPGPGEPTTQVRVRTGLGDVVLRRCEPEPPARLPDELAARGADEPRARPGNLSDPAVRLPL